MILIIGYGSIGSRHVRVLENLGQECVIVSKHQIGDAFFPSAEVAFQKYGDFKYVVVANETSKHYETLNLLQGLGYEGTVLVEKPLFHEVPDLTRYSFEQIYVAYNLRFHPFVQELKGYFERERALAFYCYVGQYLPTFRPSRNYKNLYSAKKSEGGGVLRDLSHELDYTAWLCGSLWDVQALGGHVSSLDIDTDDVFSLLCRAEYCPLASVSMNYLDRISQRQITAIFEDTTVRADFVQGTLTVNEETERRSYDSDWTYREMHKALLSGKTKHLCSFKEALTTMVLIEEMEKKGLFKKELLC